jgi:DNA-binding transcriptional MerR regulator
MDESKAIELYNFFVKEGYDVNTQEAFINGLKNSDKASELHDFFSSEGYDVGEKKNFLLGGGSVLASGTSGGSEPNLADGQVGDITTAGTYAGTIQDYKGEVPQQQPTQDFSPAMMDMSSPDQPITTTKIKEDIKAEEERLAFVKDESAPGFERLQELLQKVDLTNKSEEKLVPELNYLFKEYGFQFEEATAGNAVKVIAPNGQEKLIEYGSLIDLADPTGLFLEKGIYPRLSEAIFGGSEKYEEELRDFIQENRVISQNAENEKKKLINEQEVKEYTNDFNQSAKDYLANSKQLEIERLEIAQKYSNAPATEEDAEFLAQIKKEFEINQLALKDQYEELKTKAKKYDASIGEYAMMRTEQGGFFRQIQDSMKGGFGSALAFVVDLAVTGGATVAGVSDEDLKEFKYGEEEKFINPFSEKATKISRDSEKGFIESVEDLPFSVMGRLSTKEYLEDRQQADLFSGKGLQNILFGVSEFIPLTMATGGFGTVALSSQYVNKEMQDDPDFDNVGEMERLAVSLGIGTVVGALEKVGFTNVMQSKPLSGFTTSIATKALGKNPATMRTFNEYVEQEVKSLMAKGALKLGAGFAAEFETGAAQEAAEMGLKNLYNMAKGSDLFKTPEGTIESFKEIIMGGIAEGMGGAMMAAPGSLSSALKKNQLSEIDDTTFAVFEEMSTNSEYLNMVSNKLDQQVVNQEITKEDRDRIFNDYNRLNGAMQKMPKGIKTSQKKQLLSLFMELQKVKDNMNSTDDAFNKRAKKQKEQIEKRIDGLLKDNDIENTVDEVLNTEPSDTKVFYAEKLEDIPEQHRDNATLVENAEEEISFNEKILGLPIGKEKNVAVGDYYTYTLNGTEIDQVVESETEVDNETKTEEEIETEVDDSLMDSLFEEVESKEKVEEKVEKKVEPLESPAERKVIDVLGTQVSIDGKEGTLKEDGERIIFETIETDPEAQKEIERLESSKRRTEKSEKMRGFDVSKAKLDKEYDDKIAKLKNKTIKRQVDLGNKNDLRLSTMSDIGAKQVQLSAAEQTTFDGKEFNAPPIQTTKGEYISGKMTLLGSRVDKKGRRIVTVKDKNGLKKRFTGDAAEQIMKAFKNQNVESKGKGDYFSSRPPQGTSRASEQVSVIGGDSKLSNRKRAKYERIVNMAVKAMDAISRVLPDLKILVHTNESTFVDEFGAVARGAFDPATNIIHINLQRANFRTVGHEVLHAILVNRLKTDRNVAIAVNKMIDSVKKSVPKDVAAELEAFVKKYRGSIKNEEYIAELFGILSERYNSFPSRAKNAIRDFIRSVQDLFNLPKSSTIRDQEVFDFITTMSRKVGQGEVVQESDLALIENIDKEIKAKVRKKEAKVRQQKVDPKIEKLKEEGLYDGILDFISAGKIDLSKQLLKGAGLTFEEFQEGTVEELLKDSRYSEVIGDYFYDYETQENVDTFVKSTFKRKDPKTGEPTTIKTDDGYPLVRLEGGQYTNGDFTFESFNQLTEDSIGFGATELTSQEEAEVRSRESFKEIEQEIKDTPSIRQQKGDPGESFEKSGINADNVEVIFRHTGDGSQAFYYQLGKTNSYSSVRVPSLFDGYIEPEKKEIYYSGKLLGENVLAFGMQNMGTSTTGEDSDIRGGGNLTIAVRTPKDLPNNLVDKLNSILRDSIYKSAMNPDFKSIGVVNGVKAVIGKINESETKFLAETISSEIKNYDKSLTDKKDTPSIRKQKVDPFEFEEQGSEGKVGTIRFQKIESNPAPKVSSDKRSFAKFVKDKSLKDFNGMDFITNMYDFTTAGKFDLGNGFKMNLFGGKMYVPLMLEKRGLNVGDVSNLAAFNSKENALGFIENSKKGDATLFAPHTGGIESSWQFQHAIFEQLTKLALKKKLFSKEELISLFNSALNSKDAKKEFNSFKENYKKQKNRDYKFDNFDGFIKNPMRLVDLLNASNNYSPDLRKRLNGKFAANDIFKKAIGVKSAKQFAERMQDPLNKGASLGDLMVVVEFDNDSFLEPRMTKPGDKDYHPSFSWTVEAKIKGIYQPTDFYQSNEVTESYTKYNKDGTTVSRESDYDIDQYNLALEGYYIDDKGQKKKSKPFEGTFEEFKKSKYRVSNVASSAGAIPKKATVRLQKFDGEENYEKWKGDNIELEGTEIQDAKTGEPIVAKVYHGTTNEFYEFDASVKGNIEGHLGKVNYFTSDYQDASGNYQSEGPDLTIRVEDRSERLEQDLVDEYGNVLDKESAKELSKIYGLQFSQGEDVIDVSRKIAEKELVGTDEKVLDLYVKLNNPAVVGTGRNFIDVIPEENYADSIEDAAQEIAEEYDVTIEEAKEDYSYEVRERAIDLEGIENPLIEALQEAIDENTYDGENLSAAEILQDFTYDDEVDLNQLEKAVREGVVYAQTEDGEMAASQIVGQMFKNLGYDGIILTDVSQRFKNMGLGDRTSHVHVFDEFNNQIKLADGSNVTFGETADIRFQKGKQTVQQIIKNALAKGVSVKKIKEYLMKNKGYTQSEVDALFPKPKKKVKQTKASLVKMIEAKAKNTKKGKVSLSVTNYLINQTEKLNYNNAAAVQAFVDKVAKIYDRAGTLEEITTAKKNRTGARKSLKKAKLGASARAFVDAANEILSIKIDFIPLELLEEYNEVMAPLAKRETVKIIDVDTIRMQELLTKIQEQLEEQAEAKPEKGPTRADKNRASNIKLIKERRGKIKNELSNKYENDLADFLLSITDEQLDQMSSKSVEVLNNLLSQIENGYLSSFLASKLKTEVDGKIEGGGTLLSKINMKAAGKLYVNSMAKIYTKLTGLFSKDTDLLSIIRSTALSEIDSLLGNFNARDIYNKTFGKLESAKSKYDTELNNILNKLDKFNDLISGGKVFKVLSNKQLMSKFRIMASLLQDEFDANPGAKGVASALDYIDGTIAKLEEGGKRQVQEAELLSKLKEEIEKKGIVLSKREEQAKKIIKDINNDITEKFMFVAAMRGENPTIYNSYMHHSAMYSLENQQQALETQTQTLMNPSTKAGTTNERTTNKAISFDPAYSTLAGVKQTLLDFHMTQPIKEVRASINVVKKSKDRKKRQAGIALEKAFKESLQIVLSHNLSYYGMAEKAMDNIRRLSYYATLASVPRAAAELVSNMSYAVLSNPVSFARGAKYKYLNLSVNGAKLMDITGSGITNKNYSREALSGSRADSASFNRSLFNKSDPKGRIAEVSQFIAENSLVGPLLIKSTNYLAEKLISTPDKAIARPLWFGTFFGELQSLTGKKFTKKEILEMANGKSKYLKQYKSEIEAARIKADKENVQMSGSSNAFNSILKDQVRQTGKGSSATANAFRIINTYMGRFVKNEFNTVKSAIYALFNSGEISRPHAIGLIAAVTTRMTAYMVLYTMFKEFFFDLFDGDDDDDEKETDYAALAERQLVGSLTTLMTRRYLGNIPYIPIALATEYINETELESLRNGEPYDPFKNSLIYSPINTSDIKTKDPYELWLAAFGGPLGPVLKSFRRMQVVATRASTSAKKSTREKYKEEFYRRSLLELAGNFGLVPFYKDIRTATLNDLYKRSGKSSKKLNLTDAQKKKYMPELYRREKEYEKKLKSTDSYKREQKMKAKFKKQEEEMLKRIFGR